jgi:hypothetical protein
MEKALACLRASFRTTPSGDAGWYHYLDDPSPGVTASAVGLYCFRMAGTSFERTNDVRQYLVRQQVSGSGSTDGGWSVRTTHGFPIVEATAWVVRALAIPAAGTAHASDALRRGTGYLEANQNTDFGWGSYSGQPSRVFHTALAMLALQESGGDATIIENAQKWLINAQAPDQPAWGEVPGAEPTMLHTSFALLALLDVAGSLSVDSLHRTVGWLLARLVPGVHVERRTTAEEFDVPYPYEGRTTVFQNTLPHFAGPVAVTALLAAGADPLQRKIFDAVHGILESQIGSGSCSGAWELPRSPIRPSIWAIWPFLSALRGARSAIFPSAPSQATLLARGCAIIQPTGGRRRVTTGLLLRSALLSGIRRHRVAVALAAVAVAAIAVAVGLLVTGELDGWEFLTAVVLPALFLMFQVLWGLRRWGRKDAHL